METATSSAETKSGRIDEILGPFAGRPHELVSALRELDRSLGYLPRQALSEVARVLGVPESEVFGAASFYSMLSVEPRGRHLVKVCNSAPCHVQAATSPIDALVEQLGVAPGETTADGLFTLQTTSCLGRCAAGPVMQVDDVLYERVTAAGIRTILNSYRDGKPLPAPEREVLAEPRPGEQRIVLEQVGRIDPGSFEAARAAGAYRALEKALAEMSPARVIEEVKNSGLQGRGGAGFPAGLKWGFTAQAPGKIKYIVANADESEPGTFKDRLLMEGDPHRLLEGMAIAAFAIGAAEGYIYIRGEYPHAADLLQRAIGQAEQAGLLGDKIGASDFSFKIHLHQGAGAYICGEETALIESIEGKRGEPRIRPPFPPQRGLWGRPTAVNNVETLACVAPIITRGADWFRSIGTQGSPGTKVFMLLGDVKRRGAVEVPTGISARQLIETYGEGTLAGRAVKFVQTGGTAGSIVPPELLDVPLDYDARKQGVSLGSGVVLVVGEERCAVDFGIAVMGFYCHESCGRCTPCRVGTTRALEILKRIAAGRGEAADIGRIEKLCEGFSEAAFCGLGQSVPIPLAGLLKHFEDEFRMHIEHGGCAGCHPPV